MSTALERYLESIGHKGKYSDSTHDCTCSGTAAPPPVMVPQGSPRNIATVNEMIDNTIRIGQSNFMGPMPRAVVPAVPVQRSPVPVVQAPVMVSHNPQRNIATVNETIDNTIRIGQSNFIEPTMHPAPFMQEVQPWLDSGTGLQPIPFAPMNENGSVTRTAESPIDLTVASNAPSATNTVARKSSTGKWILGFLVAGLFFKMVNGGSEKNKKGLGARTIEI